MAQSPCASGPGPGDNSHTISFCAGPLFTRRRLTYGDRHSCGSASMPRMPAWMECRVAPDTVFGKLLFPKSQLRPVAYSSLSGSRGLFKIKVLNRVARATTGASLRGNLNRLHRFLRGFLDPQNWEQTAPRVLGPLAPPFSFTFHPDAYLSACFPKGNSLPLRTPYE